MTDSPVLLKFWNSLQGNSQCSLKVEIKRIGSVLSVIKKARSRFKIQCIETTLAWENSQHFAVPLQNDVWEMCLRSGLVLLIVWSNFREQHNQSEALTSSGWWCTISVEFLRSFLRHHWFSKESSSGIMKFWLFSQAKTAFDTSETSTITVGPSMV